MKTSLRVLVMLVMAAPLHAQEPAAVRKVGLPNLDSQVAAKLAALDARLNPVHTASLAACVVIEAAVSPLSAIAPVLVDKHNNEVWEQLADDYYRLAQESGEALVTADKGIGTGWTSGQVRRLCHQRLARLPSASLTNYRQRIDAEARALLEQGKQSRSPVPLRRVVDDLFCSSHTDRALDLLGDLAFERGQFEEARHWWGMLAPIGPARDDRLRYPDPRIDLVQVEAKEILALIFQGRLNDARYAIERFDERHPGAVGHLAGEKGPLHKALTRTLATFQRERIANNDDAWTTFGGDPARNRVLSQGLSWHLWEDGPAWRVPLPVLFANPERSSLTRRVAFHPIVVNDQVLLADHRSVVSYHLTTGKLLFRYELKGIPGLLSDDDRMPRFSLSADRNRAYVRLGRLGIGPKRAGDKEQASYLVCLDLTQPNVEKNRELWRIQANGDGAFFEGAPLVHEGRVFVALSKLVERQVNTSIVCYDVQGQKRWSRDVCECPEFDDSGTRHRQHLLTLAAGQIVYCSNAGAIVAVDAWTGQATWAVRYPSRGALTADLEPSVRDLAPCVYADGRVYVAPVDSDRILCLDAVTGQVRWEADETDVVHLLGVAQGRLFVATRNGMQAIRTANGLTDWSQPSDGRLPSLGRGLLAGGWLYWPTQDAELPSRAVTLREGKLQREDAPSVLPEPEYFEPTMLTALPAGNWAFGQGCLAIAGTSELVVFVPPDRMPNRFPMDPRPNAKVDQLYRLARAHAYAGRTDAAVAAYKELLRETKSAAWRRLIESRLAEFTPAPKLAKANSADDWFALGAKALDAKRQGQAADAFRRVLALDPNVDVRARSLLCLAKAYEGQREYRSAWQTWTALEGSKYRDMIPSANKEPYRSALAADVPRGPSLPLVQAWSQEGRVWPVNSDDPRTDVAFCTQPGAVTCRSSADGVARWKQPLAFEPTWFGRWHDLVVIAGPDAVQTLRVEDGEPAWSFVAPSRRFQPWSVVDGKPTLHQASAGFVHVKRWHDSLLLLDDGRRFYRLRLDTGEIAWQYADPSADLRPLGAAAYELFLQRVGDGLLVQDAGGQPRWLGAKAAPLGEKSRPWTQAPLLIGDRIILAGERGRVFAYDVKPPHRLAWTYQAPFAPSLSGGPCRLVGKGAALTALVPRNDGLDWVRLNAENGQALWTIAARSLGAVDVESICLGDTSIYFVAGDLLHARSLNDGAVQWTQSLPGRSSHWRLGYTGDFLTVCPGDASQNREFFVALADPWDGKWLQKLACPGARGKGEVIVTPTMVLASAGGRAFGFHRLP